MKFHGMTFAILVGVMIAIVVGINLISPVVNTIDDPIEISTTPGFISLSDEQDDIIESEYSTIEEIKPEDNSSWIGTLTNTITIFGLLLILVLAYVRYVKRMKYITIENNKLKIYNKELIEEIPYFRKDIDKIERKPARFTIFGIKIK